MRYSKPGSRRLTAYKRGYLDAFLCDRYYMQNFKPRRTSSRSQKDYDNGYATGVFYRTSKYFEEAYQWSNANSNPV
jgi:hypothetical protein